MLSGLLQSRRQLRAEARRLNLQELTELVQVFSEALAREQEKANQQAERARQAAIAKINALIEENAIDPSDLGARRGRKGRSTAKAAGKRRAGKSRRAAKKKSEVPPKYRLEVDGQEYLWSGRGRPPRVFRDYLDAGNSKESCAIG
ncbi:MAG: H-NS histone family protein [Gammaproteobacteria bacterium]|nr:H-NS histone family protein [Gammaproteobacteria bacterium]